MNPRKPPPYSKSLVDARRRGLVPRRLGCGHVAVVLGWENRATAGLHRIVIPPDANFSELDLSCVAGLEILLSHYTEESARAVDAVDSLLAAGAARVSVVNLTELERTGDLLKVWAVFELKGDRLAASVNFQGEAPRATT